MKPLLKALVEMCSVPGNEIEIRDFLIEKLKPYGSITKTRWTGFYCACKHNQGRKNRKRIVISAHMDSPGFIVRDINEDGRLEIIPLGGLDASVMDVRTVSVYASGGKIPGILHVENADDRNIVCKGFFGFSSRKDAQKAGVQKGDSVCFDNTAVELQNGYLAAPHLDDRLGCFLLLEVAKKIGKGLDCDVFFAATSCEEMGGRCAAIIAEMIRPHIALCLDTTYAEHSVEMGKGPVITLSDGSTFLPPKIRDILVGIAKRRKFPIQFEVYNYAHTDAKDYRKAPGGCLTINALIATLNNHSPWEICSQKDIISSLKLVMSILKERQLPLD